VTWSTFQTTADAVVSLPLPGRFEPFAKSGLGTYRPALTDQHDHFFGWNAGSGVNYRWSESILVGLTAAYHRHELDSEKLHFITGSFQLLWNIPEFGTKF